MMVKNILILGNGFDQAMKRKTKYEDFLEFLELMANLVFTRWSKELSNLVLEDSLFEAIQKYNASDGNNYKIDNVREHAKAITDVLSKILSTYIERDWQ